MPAVALWAIAAVSFALQPRLRAFVAAPVPFRPAPGRLRLGPAHAHEVPGDQTDAAAKYAVRYAALRYAAGRYAVGRYAKMSANEVPDEPDWYGTWL